VDNALRFLFNPILGALGAIAGFCLFDVLLDHFAAELGRWDLVVYFTMLGLGVGFAANLLASIQDGAGFGRVLGSGLLSGLVGGLGGLVASLGFQFLAEAMGFSASDLVPRLLCYLLLGTLVGLASRLTAFDRVTALAALGGFLGGGIAVGLQVLLEDSGGAIASYTQLFVSITLGLMIGATTYSLPAFISGGTLAVLTGQFKGQKKEIEDADIVVGNNKRQLQWVLPKWEGVQDPHAKIEVKKDGRGYRHVVRNMCPKTVVVVRDGKKHSIKTKSTMELTDGDVLVFATGKSFVKVRYHQKSVKG
jgi:hypothetical protein